MIFAEIMTAVLAAHMLTAYVLYGLFRIHADEKKTGEVTVKSLLIFLSGLGMVALVWIASQG